MESREKPGLSLYLHLLKYEASGKTEFSKNFQTADLFPQSLLSGQSWKTADSFHKSPVSEQNLEQLISVPKAYSLRMVWSSLFMSEKPTDLAELGAADFYPKAL